ncbi:MAG TPA: hypothetical protein VGK67_18375 [Myxococcales bacterium]|jgi:hypothetical protein
MYFNVRANGGLFVNRGELGLSVSISVEHEERPVELLALEFDVGFFGVEACSFPKRTMPLPTRELKADSQAYFQITFPTPRERLEAIEEYRKGGGPLPLRMTGNLTYREVSRCEVASWDAKGAANKRVIRSLEEPSVLNVQLSMSVSRDEWLHLLKAMGFGETTVIEIPAERLTAVEELAAGMKALAEASDKFRLGHWSDAAVAARSAIDIAAGLGANTTPDEREASFAELLRKALPNEADVRAKALKQVMQGMSTIRTKGAHGAIDFQVEREDAEFALAISSAIFRYLGARRRRGAAT